MHGELFLMTEKEAFVLCMAFGIILCCLLSIFAVLYIAGMM